MNTEFLTKIKQRPVGEVIKGLLSENETTSRESGMAIVRDAKTYGLSIRDYLLLATKPEGDLSGYEMCLKALNLPVKNDFKHGVTLQAASDTFQTFPGTRAMFPEVINDLLTWANRQDQFETVKPFLANSRTINGVELLSTVVDSDASDRDSHIVTEMGRIPVRTIRTSQNTVGFFKHGSAIRTSYEFQRRASLEVLVPYAARIARELEISKVAAATSVLVNGDGVNAAAAVIEHQSYDAATGATSTAGQISWETLLYWLLQRAKVGTPVNTVIGNWDSAFKWAMLWANAATEAKPIQVSGAQQMSVVGNNLKAGGLNIPIPTFALSSSMTASQLLGLSREDTLEELIEAGSQINESERAILNQTVTYVKTENSGYKLIYGDTRSIYSYAT